MVGDPPPDPTAGGACPTTRAGVVALGAIMLLFGTVGFWTPHPSLTVGRAGPPPPPASLPSAPPGTHPIWPAGSTPAVQPSRTATAVARDFAMRALGVSDPVVNEPPTVGPSGIGTVTIALPGGDRALAVTTQRQGDGSWVIIQVGDQSRLEGITMLPDGKPGPVMTIHPPAGATSGDVTEVAADGTHELHLTAVDLRAGVVHLVAGGDPRLAPGPPTIHTVLIVYRDAGDGLVDALGGEFG